MKTYCYFAYGSNMSKDRMATRNVDYTERYGAKLSGYRLAFNKIPKTGAVGEGYASIVADADSVVEGVLYTGVTDDGIAALDRREGVPIHYTRQAITVTLDDASQVEAFTYVATPAKVSEGLLPSRSYLNHLLRGRDLLSGRYYQSLLDWKTLD